MSLARSIRVVDAKSCTSSNIHLVAESLRLCQWMDILICYGVHRWHGIMCIFSSRRAFEVPSYYLSPFSIHPHTVSINTILAHRFHDIDRLLLWQCQFKCEMFDFNCEFKIQMVASSTSCFPLILLFNSFSFRHRAMGENTTRAEWRLWWQFPRLHTSTSVG